LTPSGSRSATKAWFAVSHRGATGSSPMANAVHVALGVRADGTKEILGLWLEQNEGAKFWLRVMNELRNRGVEDILIAVVDGLKGFPDAIQAAFPDTTVQTCIVHLLRQSLDFVSYKDRKAVAAALKGIYKAVDATAGEAALTAFEQDPWGRKYPAIGQSWRRAGARSSRSMPSRTMSDGFSTPQTP
jgi:putative transposase